MFQGPSNMKFGSMSWVHFLKLLQQLMQVSTIEILNPLNVPHVIDRDMLSTLIFSVSHPRVTGLVL